MLFTNTYFFIFYLHILHYYLIFTTEKYAHIYTKK
jgi:hypothetical protein